MNTQTWMPKTEINALLVRATGQRILASFPDLRSEWRISIMRAMNFWYFGFEKDQKIKIPSQEFRIYRKMGLVRILNPFDDETGMYPAILELTEYREYV